MEDTTLIVIIGAVVAMFSLLVAFSIQSRVSLKLYLKVKGERAKKSVLYIGVSGIIFIVALL
ncbi:MAG: hypothetical protein ACTSUE_25300 [Promethearchaeota archaeon]